MTLELSRRWINGKWSTDVADEGGGGGGSLIVTDGGTTVDPVTEIDFAGASVADGGSGIASVTISGIAQGGPFTETFDADGQDIDNVGALTATTVNVGEIAGDGTNWDVGGGKISGVDDPASDQQAATKKYVDDHVAPATLAAVLAAGNDADTSGIVNLVDPSDPQDAATKAYVDSLSGWTTITKLADQTVINNDVPVNDDTFYVIPAINTKYRIRGVIFFDTTDAADFKFVVAISDPVLSRIFVEYLAPDSTDFQLGVTSNLNHADTVVGTGTLGGFLRFDAIFTSPAEASNFRFKFAQSVATADTGATVRAGSYIEYAVVA